MRYLLAFTLALAGCGGVPDEYQVQQAREFFEPNELQLEEAEDSAMYQYIVERGHLTVEYIDANPPEAFARPYFVSAELSYGENFMLRLMELGYRADGVRLTLANTDEHLDFIDVFDWDEEYRDTLAATAVRVYGWPVEWADDNAAPDHPGSLTEEGVLRVPRSWMEHPAGLEARILFDGEASNAVPVFVEKADHSED